MMLNLKSLVLLSTCACSTAFVPTAPFVPVLHSWRSATVASDVPPGWEGGFSDSEKAFAYPNPDLSSLPVLDNMANIDKLDRMQKVLWPEFTWLTKLDDESSRCYQRFAHNISRLGYTNEGRVFSIICPQQGFGTNRLGNLNIEVTVTGQRGWVDEPAKTLAADMSVTGAIWFSPGSKQIEAIKLLAQIMSKFGPFPFTKEHAIRVTTHRLGQPRQPLFPLLNSTNPVIPIPEFAQHWKNESYYGVGTLDVAIGPIEKQKKWYSFGTVDKFNQLVVDIFNLGSGNILKDGNVLSWNVWFTKPEVVNQTEWRGHAELWRKSLEVNHVSPDGDGSAARFYDGTPFVPFKSKRLPIKLPVPVLMRSFEEPENVSADEPDQVALEEVKLIKEFSDYLKRNNNIIKLQQQVVTLPANLQRNIFSGVDAQGDDKAKRFIQVEEDLDSLLLKLDAEIEKW